jgi:two-component system chemotaxis response regulator CheB
MMNKIRVLVVDDSVTVRKYLAEIIQANPEFELVGEAESASAPTSSAST